MKAAIRWTGERTFLAESGSGHGLVIDGPVEAGGRNLGPSPMEHVLIGAGGCSAYDVILILQKMRQKVTDCRVELEAERAAKAPRVFTRIHMRYIVTGRGLGRDAVERAVRLSAETYCSATAMLGRTAAISHEIEIREADAAAVAVNAE